MKSTLIDIEVIIHHETEREPGAVLVSNDGDRKNAVWLPKSAIEIERNGRTATITLPERLAIDKGLV